MWPRLLNEKPGHAPWSAECTADISEMSERRQKGCGEVGGSEVMLTGSEHSSVLQFAVPHSWSLF